MKLTTWNNCYDNQWSGLIVPEAFSHPAKFSPGLIQKIYSYGIEQGWFGPGDTIGDPFGGICGGGIFAAFAKLQWVGLELEAKFVDLAKQNIELHRPTWEAHGYPVPIILQGDSRRFSEIIGKCEGIITSPPYTDQPVNDRNGIDESKLGKHGPNTQALAGGYGQTPGQIGKLKAGDLSAVVTSPPYADSEQSRDGDFVLNSTGVNPTPRKLKTRSYFPAETDNPANIGKLSAVVTSPPFGEANTGGGIAIKGYRGDQVDKQGKNQPDKVGPRCGYMKDVHGADPLNIGNLKMDGIVTSPPYEGTKVGGNNPELEQNRVDRKIAAGEISAETAHAYLGKHHQCLVKDQYGNSPGQVGKETGETYWQAMAQVYAECHKALKPGGHMIVVVKAYVKNKKRVPLPQQTLKLLIRLGFEPVERIKAMLTKESVNGGLFGEDIVSKKERKSFFRRLAESKGSPRIDFEEILVVRK